MSSLEESRKQIDKVDEKIVEALKSRIDTAKEIGFTKRSLRMVIHDSEREQYVLERVSQLAESKELDTVEINHIYQHIISLCRKAQGDEFHVAYLGPRGTFCEQAAHSFFDAQPVIFDGRDDIKKVFRSVSAGEAEFGVIPVENSMEGSVNIALDMLLDSDCMVYGEVEERIRHNLIVNPQMELKDIKMIISHPQALAQCRQFIEDNLPKAREVESSSTASAVKRASTLKGAAAIGTELAAHLYHMKILAIGIETIPNNYTRFLVIAKKDSPPTGRDKTSIIFAVPHKPGALHNILKSLSLRNINLTKIESRPARRTPWEYLFYCDFEGHRLEDLSSEALKELKEKCLMLKVLGSYPRVR